MAAQSLGFTGGSQIPIPCLRVRRPRHHRIRLNEPAYGGQVHPCFVVHEAAHVGVHGALTGITKIGLRDRANVRPHLTEYRFVAQAADSAAVQLQCHVHSIQPGWIPNDRPGIGPDFSKPNGNNLIHLATFLSSFLGSLQ